MVPYIATGLVVVLAVYLSVKIRANQIQSISTRKRQFEEMPSPLGQAIKDFVAVAGGVYLGLHAVIEFLRMPVPPTVSLFGLTFDPVAMTAVILAIVLPVISGIK